MALKWTNKSDLERQFALAKREYEHKAVMWFKSLGERVVRYARENGSYTDRTSNLRHSIGYIIMQNGRVVLENYSSGNGYPEAQQKAREHAMEVGRELGGNKTYLIWVAGMEYARYVEAKGFDVLQGSGDWVEANARMLIKEFERYLKVA